MKVKELIEKLEECNPDSQVNLVYDEMTYAVDFVFNDQDVVLIFADKNYE
jgi:hypothetical protein